MVAAVVLAGSNAPNGDLENLRLPRFLLPLAHARLADFVLAWLQEGGIRDVVICGGEFTELLGENLGEGSSHDLRLHYYVDREPRGPAGCCRDAMLLAMADKYVVIEGSVLPDFRLADVLKQHAMTGADATVVVAPSGNEKHSENTQTPTGVYIFEAATLAAVSSIGFQDIKEMLLPRLYEQDENVLTYLAAHPSPRLLGLDAYFAAQSWLLHRMNWEAMLLPGYLRTNDVFRHDTAILNDNVQSIGPVMLGPGSKVASGVTFIGPVVIGRDCVIEEGCLIQRSILWDGCVVETGSQIDHCLLTSGSRLHAGTSIAGQVCDDELEYTPIMREAS